MGKAWLLSALQAVIEEANGGDWPSRLRHWRQVGRRLGHRIDWMDPEWGMDAHAVSGVVYINRWLTRPLQKRRDQLETELRHEMIETACLYEGVPPIYYPAQWGDHHEMTVALEDQILETQILEQQMTSTSDDSGSGDEAAEEPGFLARPLEEWPLNLRKALGLVQMMPPEVQEHIIDLWLDQAEPHYRIAMALKEARETLARVEQEITTKQEINSKQEIAEKQKDVVSTS